MSAERKENEKDVEAYVCKLAEGCGGEAYKFTSPQRKNVPDRLVSLIDKPMFMIECKSEGESPTPGQWREIKRLRARGVVVFVCDTKQAVREAFDMFARMHS